MSEFSISRNWRLQKVRYGLVGEICPKGHLIFPPRDICPNCIVESRAQTPYQFSGKGEVYSYTTIFEPTNAPEGYEDQAPYTVALVRLIEEESGGERIEGPLVTAMLTDLDTDKPREAENQKDQRVFIGQQIEMVTRKLKEDGERGMLVYGYKFRPVLEPASPDFSIGKLVDLAQCSAADPKNEALNAQYLKMFPCHSALDAESI